MTTTLAHTNQRLNEVSSTDNSYPMFVPRCDIWEDDNEFVVYGDMPGVMPDGVDIRFQDGRLLVHGKVTPRQNGVGTVVSEFGVGDFHRTFAIGQGINVDGISAEMQDGVLVVHLPKSENMKPRRIQVKVS